jgi:hypothetical protein
MQVLNRDQFRTAWSYEVPIFIENLAECTIPLRRDELFVMREGTLLNCFYLAKMVSCLWKFASRSWRSSPSVCLIIDQIANSVCSIIKYGKVELQRNSRMLYSVTMLGICAQS